uniref:Uncharacterized protein n=1 Tax=Lygus hesperus TaxID=30085 RepID=A0A146M562_LYGHE
MHHPRRFAHNPLYMRRLRKREEGLSKLKTRLLRGELKDKLAPTTVGERKALRRAKQSALSKTPPHVLQELHRITHEIHVDTHDIRPLERITPETWVWNLATRKRVSILPLHRAIFNSH